MFQLSGEKITMEMNLVGEADIKVDSEEFCDANDDQANYNGMRSIIDLMLHRFYCCFYDYIFISIKYRSLYSAVE